MRKVHVLGGVAATALLAAAAIVSPQAFAEEVAAAPPSGKITVEVLTANGSGCPAGSADVTPSADNTSFTVAYDNYVARDGGGAEPTDIRKNCQLSLQVGVPQGFTFAIARADYRGYVYLRNGATASQNAYYYFMGESETTEVNNSFSGPISSRWHTSDVTAVAALVWAPCGEQVNLNVNTDLRVRAGTAESSRNFISMDRSSAGADTVFQLSWKRC
jgi:hypothetical protein